MSYYKPLAANFLELAQLEIYKTYGHRTTINRKTLRKYGRSTDVGTTEIDINSWNVTATPTETLPSTNAIDSISSSNAADTAVVVYIEGMTISSGVLTFVSQTKTLNGQSKVTLDTPLARCTRVRCAAVGDIYVYQDSAITAGVPNDLSKVHNKVLAAENTSLKAGTSIASTNYFILTHYWATMGKAAGSAAVDVRVKIANLDDEILGNNFYTDDIWAVSLDSPLEQLVLPYEIIKPNSDIVMTGVASSGTQAINAGFMGFFADIVS
jgi:hypothetical protein